MSSSTSIDVNYLSLAGNGEWTMYAGSPIAVVVPEPTNWDLSSVDGSKYASVLKLADGAVFTKKGLKIPQGNECAVDINNHAVVDIEGEFGSDNFSGNQIFSVKGGSSAKIAGIVHGTPNRLKADILVDNWSDQSYNGSIVSTAGLKHSTGRNLRTVKRFGASIVDASGNFAYSLLLTLYWNVKWLARKVCGIKIGQKGPAWI